MNFYAVDTKKTDWNQIAEGVEQMILCNEPGQRRSLVRFVAGTNYKAHRHPQGEEVFVLEGTLEDSGNSYGPGTYLYYAPGTSHQVSSTQGCLFLLLAPVAAEIL